MCVCFLRYRGSVVLKSEGLWNILRLQSKMERGALLGAAKRGLFKALVLAGAAVDDAQRRGEYWLQVTVVQSLIQRLDNFIKVQSISQVLYFLF